METNPEMKASQVINTYARLLYGLIPLISSKLADSRGRPGHLAGGSEAGQGGHCMERLLLPPPHPPQPVQKGQLLLAMEVRA